MSVLPGTEVLPCTGAAVFAATHWSVVLAAKRSGAGEGMEALETLCRVYWPPLYGYVRRQGYGPHDAQDLTQAFFERLLEKDYLSDVDRRKGKFRSFLLAAFKNFLAKEWRNSHCQKRGGKGSFISLDDPSGEPLYAQAPANGLSPEKFFERQWATTLLEQVLRRLREEFLDGGKEAQFERLKVFLTGERAAGSYARLAAELGTTQGALKMVVTRMKRRYGQLLREEIARTVSAGEAVEEELRALFVALSG
jgi:RNA polymerase sigma factor (sigma-70 family)